MIPAFFTAPCPCQGERTWTLAARALGPQDSLVWVCSACDAPDDEAQGRWASPEELVALGYFIDGYEPPARHGEPGGCRGGRCGVAQPGDPAV